MKRLHTHSLWLRGCLLALAMLAINASLLSQAPVPAPEKTGILSTDKLDYLPGDVVTITGNYWQPGETVDMVLSREPETQPPLSLASVADDYGNFTNTDYTAVESDRGVTFTLTATGRSSGFRALTQFTDGGTTLPAGSQVGAYTAYPTYAKNGYPAATTDLNMACANDCTRLINPPFPVMIYDRSYTQAAVGSNGNIQFETNNAGDFNGNLNTASDFQYALFPLGDDLAVAKRDGGSYQRVSGLGVYSRQEGNDFWVEWRASTNVNNPATPATENFAVRMKNGKRGFEYTYGSVTQNDVVIGIIKDTSFLTQYSRNVRPAKNLRIVFSVPGDDWDSDGVINSGDNCVADANADQANPDGDTYGSACDPFPNDSKNDEDGDGLGADADNCPLVANADQKNNDGDDKGDVCDPDDDNDGVLDAAPDNCPLIANPDQLNSDADANGNACDADDDNDGVPDASDNCPVNHNPDQADRDNDGKGNVCDLNSAPTAVISANSTYEATSAAGASVTLSAAGSTDPENDPLTFAWTVTNGVNVQTATGATATLTLKLGSNSVKLVADDGQGNTGTATKLVSVVDTTAPVLTLPAAIEKTAEGASAAVTFTATATDAVDGAITPVCSPASGASFSLGQTAVTCTATDAASNIATGSFNVTVVDRTAPEVSCGAADGVWHSNNVSITCSATDTGSGLAGAASFSLSTSLAEGQESANASTNTVQVCDNAGNCAAAGPVEGNKIDRKAPAASVTALANSLPYAADTWTKYPVTVQFGCQDAGSGVPAPPADQTFTAEGAGQQASAECVDGVGNKSTASFSPIKIDTSAPTVSCVPAATGWQNANIAITCTASDGLSGLNAAASSLTLSTDVADGQERSDASTNEGNACDNAGNCTKAGPVTGLMVDRKKPVLTASGFVGTQAYAAGTWTNQDVTVKFVCTDGGSGSAGNPADKLLHTEGDALSAAASCQDNVGNQASTSFGPVKIDKTNPSVTCPAADGQWHADNVTLTCTANDALSGVDSAKSSLALATTVAPDVENPNAATGSGTACDQAGNCVTAGPVGGNKIDRKKPQASASAWFGLSSYTAGTWVNGTVTVKFGCTDLGSGVGVVDPDLAVSGEGANQIARGRCTDAVGNIADFAEFSPINIDLTKPTLHPTVSPNPVVLNGSATATPSATDALSGVASSSCGAVVTSTVGNFQVTCTATDNAGNSNSAQVQYNVGFGVCVLYDTTKAHKRGSTVPVKLQLCDVAGRNVSAPNSVVTATQVVRIDNSASAVLDDSGAANMPDYNFRFDAALGPGYIFNLSTKSGYSTGTYEVRFTVTGDPTAHGTRFDVR